MAETTTFPVRIVGGPATQCQVPLRWQYELDGKTWSSITIRRISVGEIAAYSDAVRVAESEGKPAPKPPMFDCPAELLDALFPDDDDAVEAAVSSFLAPARREEPLSPSTAAETP